MKFHFTCRYDPSFGSHDIPMEGDFPVKVFNDYKVSPEREANTGW